MKFLVLLIVVLFNIQTGFAQSYINLAHGKPVTTSWNESKTKKITDASLITGGVRFDPKGQNHWIEIDLTAEFKIGGIQLYFDHGGILPLRDFSFQYKKAENWVNIPNSGYKNNFASNLNFTLPEPISSSAIRMMVTCETTFGILEIQVWGRDVPTQSYGLQIETEVPFQTDKHLVCVNQVAYNFNAPKGFTVPTAKTNLPFVIKEKKTDKVVYQGKLQNGKGDFTRFNPADLKEKEYFIYVEGDGLKPGASFPFVIGQYAIQKMAYQPAVKFFNDARSMVGSHASAYGGTAWRDGTYYTYEVPSMVLLYLSDPEAFDKMPVTLSWAKETEFLFSPDFKATKEPNDKDALSTAKAYYSQLPPPKSGNIPDIIQNIRFGIGWNLLDPVSADPSGDLLGEQLHGQTIEQFAFFLYGYPAYQQYIEKEFYQKVLDSTLKWWTRSGLLEVQTTIGNGKGRHCPGHSILPNLLMYEVAKREKLANPEKYLEAAQNQTKWIIENADWNNPAFTKGQRQSEHKLVTGLAFFMNNYPEQAPRGLKKKLVEWAENAVSLSDNMWDFRKFDKNNWTLPGYNEVGNVIAFPACALSVAMVLENGSLSKRLVELAYAHYDNFSGRNPQNAHCANHPELGFVGIEKAWPFPDPRHDVCARLENVRGALCSLPGSEMYPFNPNGLPRHGEGWTVYNANWNVSLAYLNFYENVSGYKMLKKQ
jgi:F5/8 type C domain